MKKTILLFSFLFTAGIVSAQTSVWQNGYTKSNGTYVNGHYKTTSNSTNWDNYSTKGNTNPYSGKSGTKARDYSGYNSKATHTGPRGGRYYINSNGNKTYVPKQ